LRNFILCSCCPGDNLIARTNTNGNISSLMTESGTNPASSTLMPKYDKAASRAKDKPEQTARKIKLLKLCRRLAEVARESDKFLIVLKSASSKATAGMPNQAKYIADSIVINLIRLRCKSCYHRLK
jgi:hypothetical protein